MKREDIPAVAMATQRCLNHCERRRPRVFFVGGEEWPWSPSAVLPLVGSCCGLCHLHMVCWVAGCCKLVVKEGCSGFMRVAIMRKGSSVKGRVFSIGRSIGLGLMLCQLS